MIFYPLDLSINSNYRTSVNQHEYDDQSGIVIPDNKSLSSIKYNKREWGSKLSRIRESEGHAPVMISYMRETLIGVPIAYSNPRETLNNSPDRLSQARESQSNLWAEFRCCAALFCQLSGST